MTNATDTLTGIETRTLSFDSYEPLNIRDLYDAEQEARAEGRTEAADALERRRNEVATRDDGSDARYVCSNCGGNEVDEQEYDGHKEVQRYTLYCEDCDEVVGTKVDGVTTRGNSVTGVREVVCR
jgi:hypothetical protein